MALGLTQPPTEISTRSLPGGKGRLAREDENLAAISEPTVYKMWQPRRFTTLWAFTAFYSDNYTFYLYHKPPNGTGGGGGIHSRWTDRATG
jgi:hypothetical protein